ncbi:Uncharacterised protein [Mycobacteroides abscessus subsp. abscessus]|nr:Uncharacterised protein [Mycobacteroides abscessus subsp. abscessus]
MFGCAASSRMMWKSIGTTERGGMSYRITGTFTASATAVKCASSPACEGRE